MYQQKKINQIYKSSLACTDNVDKTQLRKSHGANLRNIISCIRRICKLRLQVFAFIARFMRKRTVDGQNLPQAEGGNYVSGHLPTITMI